MTQDYRRAARKIKPSKDGVTGRLGPGKEFELLLERDFYLLLELDAGVKDYRTQPFVVDFRFEGRGHHYTPDVLIHYRLGPSAVVEVKPSELIEEDESLQAAKFAATRRVCDTEGWTFAVVTEEQIRTPRLKNAELLIRFKRRCADPERAAGLRKALEDRGACSIADLLRGLESSLDDRAKWLPDLWTLIVRGEIGVNLDERITMSTCVHSVRVP